MRSLLLVFFLLLGAEILPAQLGYELTNNVYQEHIKSVRFHVNGLLLSYPIVDLNSNVQLALSFDDLDAGNKNYFYTVIHCDADWTPSQLADMEYLDGFTEERIEDFQFSFKTIQPYTHYELRIPNNSIRWTKSGNYVLVVYEDNGGIIPILSRRFLVVDKQVKILPRVSRANKVDQLRTHQEIDFNVQIEQFRMRNPRQEIRATVLQNGRWDNAITNIEPLFIRGDVLSFDYQGEITFPAGREFRFLDIRSLRFRPENVSEIVEYKEGFEVILFKDRPRGSETYLEFKDLNGQFIIENRDQNGDGNLTADYADVLFSLYAPEPWFDDNVYLVGWFSDWKQRDAFRMIYNQRVNAYVTKVRLKQGFYDYAFARVNVDSKEDPPPLRTDQTEGNWHETENDYLVLIYYRPFGGRYDQLIGAQTINSN